MAAAAEAEREKNQRSDAVSAAILGRDHVPFPAPPGAMDVESTAQAPEVPPGAGQVASTGPIFTDTKDEPDPTPRRLKGKKKKLPPRRKPGQPDD